MDALIQQSGSEFRHQGIEYLAFLSLLNQHLAPRSYLEIGTSEGWSLDCFTCDAICIDPAFRVTGNTPGQRKRTLMFQMRSDEFFADYRVRDYFPGGVDLAFLDGMHRFEFLLRDFMNTERSAHRRSLILIHDCLPLNGHMAERCFTTGADEDPETAGWWTGDVWRMLPILKKYRPDLRVRVLDCPPTGLVAVSNLNPDSDILDRNYQAILDEFGSISFDSFGLDAIWGMYPIVATQTIATEDAITAVLSVW